MLATIINKEGNIVGGVVSGAFFVGGNYFPIEALMSIYDCGYSLKLD